MEQLENDNKEKTVRIAERFKFFRRDQLKEETITIYMGELKKLATTCEFNTYLEEALCDKFVCGINDINIQANLLTKHDLTLDDAYRYALTMEVTGNIDENKPILYRHEEEKGIKLNNGEEGVENIHYLLDIKEELQPLELQEEFQVHQEFVDLQCEPNLPIATDSDEQFFFDDEGKKKFVCEFCQSMFSNKAHLKRHALSHTGEKLFFCSTCNTSFSRRESLQRHTKKSSVCLDYEKQKPKLKENRRASKRRVEHVCSVCGRPFLKKAHLERHFRIHTGEKPYICAICKNRFTRKESLQQHLQIHARDGNDLKISLDSSAKKKTLKCKIGNKTFLNKVDLERYLGNRTENGKPNEKIKILDPADIKEENIDTSTVGSGKTEKEILSLKKVKKRFLCHICDYRTSKGSGLDIHLKRHMGEKPFACDICKFKAVCKNDLKIHKRIHSAEKMLICEFCGYKTNYSGLLQTHIRSHTGEKPFQCKFCDYKCAERNSLKNHVRIHTGEKPFSCSFCDYRAAQRTGLVYHLKTHKKEKALATEKVKKE